MRIFLDANVLFSASNERSSIARLAALVVARHVAVTSDLALEEAERNVRLKRPKWEPAFVALTARLEVVPTADFPLLVEVVEKDRPILCAAIRSGCEVLATGDRRHFGHLFDTRAEGVLVVTPTRLAEMLLRPA